MHKEEEDDKVTNLLPAKAFEMLSITSRHHHQMNNNELNEFKQPSFQS
jgi:hypothetical protein